METVQSSESELEAAPAALAIAASSGTEQLSPPAKAAIGAPTQMRLASLPLCASASRSRSETSLRTSLANSIADRPNLSPYSFEARRLLPLLPTAAMPREARASVGV